MNLYQASDYKVFLLSVIEENKLSKGFRSRLAEAAGCQKSFLSQVLNSAVHLTPDHGAGIGLFLNFNASEADYFLALIDHARAGTETLKTLIRARIEQHQRRNADISENWKHERKKEIVAEAMYYSSWHVAAVHVLVSIPGFGSVRKISERLALPPQIVQETLHQLEKLGLVRNESSKWKTSEKRIHLAKNALMAEIHHTHWRHRAILDTQKKDPWSMHFSSIFAISRIDAEIMREELLDFIVELRNKVGPSTEEDLYCFNADLFII